MIEVKDRVPSYPGRVKLVPVSGQENVYDMVRMDEPTEAGTPINKALFDSILNNLKTGVYINDSTCDIGEMWQDITLPSAGKWLKPTYGNGIYVTAKYDSYTGAYSQDGVAWTAVTLPFTGKWSGCAYGNGRFVLVSDTTVAAKPSAAVSSDGKTWTSGNTGIIATVANWTGPVFDGKRFVVAGRDNGSGSATTACYTSADGRSWTSTNFNSAGNWCDIAVISPGTLAMISRTGNYVATGSSAYYYASPIGVSGSWTRLLYGNGIFGAFSQTQANCAHTSKDSSAYTSSNFPDNTTCSYFEFGNGVFVAVPSPGDKVFVSPDCTTWTTVTLPGGSSTWGGLVFADKKFVLLDSSASETLVSNDGLTWTNHPKSGNYMVLAAPYAVNDRVFALSSMTTTVAKLSGEAQTGFERYAGQSLPLFMNQIRDMPDITQRASGSYTGGGVARLDWQNYLSFDFIPRFGVVVGSSAAGNISCVVFSETSAISLFGTGTADPSTIASSINAAKLTVTRSGNTIMWKSMLDDLDSAKKAQCNVSGVTYYYTFLG